MILRGPQFSLQATGTKAGIITYQRTGARAWARKHVPARNPQTDAQMRARALFAWLSQRWLTIPDDQQLTWSLRGTAAQATAKNVWIGQQIANWQAALYPANLQPAERAQTPAIATITSATRENPTVAVVISTDHAPDTAGYALHRGATTDFTCDRTSAIAWANEQASGSITIIDPNAPAAPIYYRVVAYTNDGNASAPSASVSPDGPTPPTDSGPWLYGDGSQPGQWNPNGDSWLNTTAINIGKLDANGDDRSTLINGATHVRLEQQTDPTVWAEFDFAAPPGDGGTYWGLTLTGTTGGLALFNAAELYTFTFT